MDTNCTYPELSIDIATISNQLMKVKKSFKNYSEMKLRAKKKVNSVQKS
jgi:hypothetical protein